MDSLWYNKTVYLVFITIIELNVIIFITHPSCKLNWRNKCNSPDVLVLTNSVSYQQNK
jgi:hypothetical protein